MRDLLTGRSPEVRDLVRALGIDTKMVRRVQLDLEVGSAATVTVEAFASKDGVMDGSRFVQDYHLCVERAPTPPSDDVVATMLHKAFPL